MSRDTVAKLEAALAEHDAAQAANGPPSSIVVGPFTYTVSLDEQDLLRASRDEQTVLVGHCNPAKLRITIDAGQALGSMRDTVLHEVLHAVTDLTGINHEHTSEVEETLVRRLAPALLGVLRTNPALVEWLTATDDEGGGGS